MLEWLNKIKKVTLLWFRLLISAFSLPRTAFELKLGYVGFLVHKVELEKYSIRGLFSPLPVSFYQFSIVGHLSVTDISLLKPTGHVMHQQFNIQQLYVLPTLYLCVLYLSENKQRLVALTA